MQRILFIRRVLCRMAWPFCEFELKVCIQGIHKPQATAGTYEIWASQDLSVCVCVCCRCDNRQQWPMHREFHEDNRIIEALLPSLHATHSTLYCLRLSYKLYFIILLLLFFGFYCRFVPAAENAQQTAIKSWFLMKRQIIVGIYKTGKQLECSTSETQFGTFW